jgi:polysaccharide biosynthesis transport protein
MEFKSIINTIYRRRLLVICVFAAFFLPLFLGAFLIGPWYESTAKVWVYRSKASTSFLTALSLTSNSVQSATVADSERESYISLAKVRPVVDKVIAEMQLTKVRTRYRILEAIPLVKPTLDLLGIKYGPTSKAMTTKEMTDSSLWLYLFPYPHLEASQDGDSDLIEIKATSPDAKQAQDIANKVARQFIEVEFQRAQNDYREVKNFIAANIDKTEKEYTKALKALEAFRIKEKTISLDTEASNLLGRMTSIRQSQEEAELNVYKQQAAWRSLNEQLKSTPEFQHNPDFDVRVTESISSLKTKLTDMYVDLAEAKNRYGEKHPTFIELKDRIAQARENLRKELGANIQMDSVYQSLREKMADDLADLAGNQAMAKAWSTVLARYDKELLTLPPKQAQYTKLNLAVTASSSVHQVLLEFQNKTSLAEFFDVQALRLVESADAMSRDDAKPSLKLNTALGIILGVFFGLGAAFMVEYLDDSVKTSGDLRTRSRGVYLGSVARPARRHGRWGRWCAWTAKLRPAMTPPEESASIISQALRLRAGGVGPRSVVVTSALGDDGAAYLSGMLARRLARGLAQEGGRVVLVDADLAAGEQHEALGAPGKPGLAEFLAGKAGAKEVCQATKVSGLSLVPRGGARDEDKAKGGPGLDARAMRGLLEGLGEEPGLVVVAAPPLLADASAMNLLGWAEAVVFCAEAARTSGRDLDEALELAAGTPAALKGMVLYQAEGTFWYRL